MRLAALLIVLPLLIALLLSGCATTTHGNNPRSMSRMSPDQLIKELSDSVERESAQ